MYFPVTNHREYIGLSIKAADDTHEHMVCDGKSTIDCNFNEGLISVADFKDRCGAKLPDVSTRIERSFSISSRRPSWRAVKPDNRPAPRKRIPRPSWFVSTVVCSDTDNSGSEMLTS